MKSTGTTRSHTRSTQKMTGAKGKDAGNTQRTAEAKGESGEKPEEAENLDTIRKDKRRKKTTREKGKEVDESEILVEDLTELAEEALQSRRDRAMYYIACTLKTALQDVQKAQVEIQEGIEHVVGVAEMLVEEMRTGRGKEHKEATEEEGNTN